MKIKKKTNILAVSGVCALIFFAGVAFPLMLAASPENREPETIEMEVAFPTGEPEVQDTAEQTDESGQSGDSEQQDPGKSEIDINAMSMEMALEIVKEIYGEDFFWQEPTGTSRGTSVAYLDAKYMESSNPANAPSWFFLVEMRFWGEQHFYEFTGGYDSLEDFIAAQQAATGDHYEWSIGTDNEGTAIARGTYAFVEYFIAEINAFTGEYVSKSEVAGLSLLSFDGISKWEDLKEHLSHIFELIPEPMPRPVTEPTPEPTPEPYPISPPQNLYHDS